jgi:Fe-S-cluster containining protein
VERSEKRRLQKAMRKAGPEYIRRGMSLDAQPEEAGAVALILRDKLMERKNPRSASEMASLALDVYDRAVAAEPALLPIACQSGCSFCCYLYASATAPEIFSIVRRLRSTKSAERLAKVRAGCEPLKGLDVDARHGAKIPCPLLTDNRCSIYEVRPIACRMCVSMSAAACEAAFHGSDEDIARPAAHLYAGANARLALNAAIESTGRPDHSYELGEALAVALTMPDAEARWLAGEDVFAGCQIDSSRDAELVARSTFLAEIIG